jgi:hypothetical protein
MSRPLEKVTPERPVENRNHVRDSQLSGADDARSALTRYRCRLMGVVRMQPSPAAEPKRGERAA